ncbi:MAG TPA: hypothetical protein VEO54_05740 [Thermoanaerobaculia bacterium]|nr:hypothetical protein [Thermoanaerobaculia bacterium]
MSEMDADRAPQSYSDARAQWESEKIAFGRAVLAEARVFLELDNSMIRNFAAITAAAAAYTAEHPDRVFAATGTGDIGSPLGAGGLAGGGFGDDLLGLIRDVVVKDKEFFLGLITKLFGI